MGRFRVETAEGPTFTMVAINQTLTLTLVEGSLDGPLAHARRALPGEPPSLTLEGAVSASGARYTAPDAEVWSHGETVRITLGGVTFAEAPLQPLVVGSIR